ncbi:hypothetical protein MMC07_001182 [Pseudocyphellaria aurata]|nr:hypothetical protein [Pseudocyphellaria aurata]
MADCARNGIERQFISSSTTIPIVVPLTFQPLPLGSIKPLGWLSDQMNLMADGFAGHMAADHLAEDQASHEDSHQDFFYPIVRDSPWLGGTSEYSGLNEGLPYWLNGLVPLAYGLDNARLKTQVNDITKYVLFHQKEDGWLGPEEEEEARDLWGRFPLMLGLSQLVEANKELSHIIVRAMYKFVILMHDMLAESKGLHEIWGRVRYPDMMICLQWLYEYHPREDTKILLDTMRLLREEGFSWEDYYDKSKFIFKDLDEINPPITADHPVFPYVHAVNAGQGLKSGAAIYRFTADKSLLESTRNGVNWTFAYHGDVAGSIIGDERESDRSPNRGSELCTAGEVVYSLSYLYQVLGDSEFADRCELAAFNALSVGFSSNHWGRQYITLANQPFSHALVGPKMFWNVGDAGVVYGPATNYPCCTVNTPQGVPKFLSASFVKVGQDGLGHALLSPARVTTNLQNGARVSIHCESNYPFSNTLYYTVSTSSGFVFYVRVPHWYIPALSFYTINDCPRQTLAPDPHTGMTAIHLHAGTHQITYVLSAVIRFINRTEDTVSVYHGALLYALDVGQSRRRQAGSPLLPSRARDDVIENTRPWNIAIDPASLIFHAASPNASPDQPLQSPIWSPGAPPSYITGKGCEIDWPLLMGMPAPVPKAINGTRTCTREPVDVVLRPYGSLKIHMAELPTVNLNL